MDGSRDGGHLVGAPTLEEYLHEIRRGGWSVAAHYDYKALGGERQTYWLFVLDGVAVEGVGANDRDAVLEALAVIQKKATAEAQVPR